ncbi:FtsK/SpoIIIE domain-containing protein [Microbacterium sp. zg.Y1090]|uniref:FtsK/SpoIIIE domain-containing protein n=1 Tax=Microbacterium TaxID=33882 RepID=UPI00214CCC83|nr:MULTISPECIES: FtsK/SpoIIIE domain-containing protein [unclassified Microbacterium]MCR2813464.1 FtsK/SpoIIIE domain-containing protein [Microbacterium sp. zg.Y1084]MCR2818200.1 FtsK/SpoIIIE domain-containing protein [Microbacterium sp. zg.Y1090]MDL5486721.1 FtsK/SpoIIIE domain-containing protein [Microbacterium sp. zg-Y1211]WIM27650.1 FtsK/SpoIIIE domain-containing protein [Microbacterium sp. zg-Y1090]
MISDDEPLTLPKPAQPVPRPALPFAAALLPVAAALGLWAITGSVLSLWFAALGPLLAGGAALDGLRAARRDRRRARRSQESLRASVAARLAARHATERGALSARHPDVAGCLAEPEGIWRTVPGRAHQLRVGTGQRPSAVRVVGGGGDEEDAALRAQATRLDHAPVTVPLGDGVAVVGPPVAAAAVGRALLAQVCLVSPPGEVRLVGPVTADGGWTAALPHRRCVTGMAVQLCEQGTVPERGVEAPIALVAPRMPPPPRCAAVLTLTGLGAAWLDHGGFGREVRVEALGRAQATAVATALDVRAGAVAGAASAPSADLALLLPHAPSAAAGTLPAVIGRDGGEAVVIDLAVDGPHALVTGVTGAGKSELLTTWIASLCATHTTAQVAFLLADFKGGRAFDRLAALPHVTGVLTDLDEAAAHRAIHSLRAELRHRERVLAEAGARDVDEAGEVLPRLVIVVDEYAALVGTQPELHALFADIAARGRALGMHLILAGQRAAGVFRDALLANCPLRVSLRVTDVGDARLMLGGDDAALLPGEPAARGLALVRRAADRTARGVRVAVCDDDTLARLAAVDAGAPPRRPWLPALPDRLPLQALQTLGTADGATPRDGAILLGLADEPDRQRQRPVLLTSAERGLVVVGGPGSGKTGVLRAAAAQHDAGRTLVVPRDPEAAWDALAGTAELPPGTLVLVDDLDALPAPYGPDHEAILQERVEALVRDAGRRGIRVIVTTQRLTGIAGRVAPLLTRRAILSLPSRADHVAAGGEARDHHRDLPPGRGVVDGLAVQFALAESGLPEPETDVPLYRPRGLVGLVAPASPAAREVRERWQSAGVHVVPLGGAARTDLPTGPTALWGEPETWLREWRTLQEVRASGALLVDAACSGDVRAVTASRAAPPYAAPGRDRAWLWDAASVALRVRLR